MMDAHDTAREAIARANVEARNAVGNGEEAGWVIQMDRYEQAHQHLVWMRDYAGSTAALAQAAIDAVLAARTEP